MRKVHIETSAAYDVLIGGGLLPRAGELMAQVIEPCTAAIITDTTVDALYGGAVEKSLKDAGYSTLRYAFPAGERNKRLSTLEGILEFLAENHVTRSDVVVALGGGVPGDVAGFAAAIYARGIRFVQIATTLLAAVDSSVGGKTAVDLAGGKNMAGAFHQPTLVITDTDVMRALPGERLSDGAGEIVKYGVLVDPGLFEMMGRGDWLDHLDEIIEKSVSIKRDVVNADEFDVGQRRLLNLGHTFGHAIEKCAGFTLAHGQCVGIGTAIAAGAAGDRDMCRRILAVNRACGLPTDVDYSCEALAEAALSDKKRQGARIALVLPDSIGSCYIKEIDVAQLPDAFKRGVDMVKELAE
jgi:3-dehydroquinate synthase